MMVFFNTNDETEELDPYEEELDDSATVTERVIGWLWFFFKLGFAVSIILIIVVTGALIGVIKGFSERIPIVADSSYRPNLTSEIFDVNGKLIARLHGEENRTRILSSLEIPDHLKQAVVAIEDERFYHHYGVDIVGITRAMLTNIKAGRIVQGASTLTQQLVKNAFLTTERTYQRKAIEAMMAFQLERRYSKEEIITLYLNEIYFGHGAYGVAAAAEMYFGKKPEELTIAESAMLASIPKSPSAFSPVRNPKNNSSRRALVLAKMAELDFITPAQYQEARDETPELLETRRFDMKAPYFTTYVRDQLLDRYGAELVYKGGLKVYTTLDLKFQEYAEQAMASAAIFAEYPIETHPLLNGSLVTIEPRNGHIKTMYGGRSFEQSQFNRVSQAYRQPGSSFKPFVFAAALEDGMLPSDTIVDEFISYTNPWNKQVWSPKNYDGKFHGRVSLMKALARSYNIPAVKLIDRLTPARVVRFAKRMGVSAQLEPNLSLALGSGEMTPLEMASAFGVFVNGGIYIRPLSILKVEDRDGNILEENSPRGEEIMSAVNAAIMCDMLKTAVERGTGRRAHIEGYAIGGKTGTTNNYIDAWFNGFTPELVTIVQFGFDQPRTLGPRKAGGAVAGPVWKQYMESVLKHYPRTNFSIPEGSARVRACMVSGNLASRSCPNSEVVSQVFPIESQPTVECRHSSFVARVAPVAVTPYDIESEYLMGAELGHIPEPGFFRGDYSGSISARPSQTSHKNAPATPGVWIPRETQKTSQDALQRWGVDQPIPPEAFLDPSLVDSPAVESEPAPREPGVVVDPPKIQFRDDYR